jgi:hypothetical protein
MSVVLLETITRNDRVSSDRQWIAHLSLRLVGHRNRRLVKLAPRMALARKQADETSPLRSITSTSVA